MSHQAVDSKAHRQHNGNTERLLNLIRCYGRISRSELSTLTGMTLQSIASLLNQNALTNVVTEQARGHTNRGRASVVYRFVADESAAAHPFKKTGPCLGGCGKTIRRDGVRFMCALCRQNATNASPYSL